MTTTRINKRVAELGIASRREADELIAAGKIMVNGKSAVIGQKVSAGDTVELAGTTKDRVYLAYYKGRGVISHSPDQGEIDIVTKLKTDYQLENVYPVGRLDKDSEGLIIITNDGRITAPLLDASSETAKTYEVEVDKPVTNFLLKHLRAGVNIEGYTTKPAKAEQTTAPSKRRLLLTLTEGKKHQIRRMCAALGFQVQSLKRVQIANIELGQLKPNQYRKITGPELRELLNLLNVTTT